MRGILYLRGLGRSRSAVFRIFSLILGFLAVTSGPLAATVTYDVQVLGFIDAEHTRDTDGFRDSSPRVQPNPNLAGKVIGHSKRYGTGGTNRGTSAWLVDGATTLKLGFTDSEHTNPDGWRNSVAQELNNAGHVRGYSQRYSSASNLGQTAWLYDGTSTIKLGFTDSEHTRESDGYRNSSTLFLNESGLVAGRSSRYTGSSGVGTPLTAWLYDGTSTSNIGLTDAEHTRITDGIRHSFVTGLNNAGQLVGGSNRYRVSDGIYLGITAWRYEGGNHVNIGLTDAEHTDPDGSRKSIAQDLNEAGQVMGVTDRISGWEDPGQSAWLYDGTTTLNIGLLDAEHTHTPSGERDSVGRYLNEAGQVAGEAVRYGVGQGTVEAPPILGQTAWLYNGATTLNVGLTDAEHTSDSNGERGSYIQDLNELGQVTGVSSRYGAGGTDLGRSTWLYDGTSTSNIGLTDGLHTRDVDGYRYSATRVFDRFLNEAGQVIGLSNRYGAGGTDLGQTAWFYDDGTTYALDGLSTRSDGYGFSVAEFLSDDGMVFGRYELFDDVDASLGFRAFQFTVENGLFDLGSLIDEGFDDWVYLTSVISMNANGVVVGEGLLTDMTDGNMTFLLTPNAAAVPVPASMWLFVSALSLIGWARRTNLHSSIR
jgi:hypothetical protein